ncbi:MAG: hypothetical protein KIG47_07915 [Prevotellamassilia sp.]|nr:hypothetical protein [Prevotellamassilia sp.]MCI6143429.1 hypothetical protein [Bacteroidales bacterium]MDY4568136.1 hypothetical protein [Alloprevotella sp.]
MKKTYITPKAQAVALMTEDTLLSISNPKVSNDNDPNKVVSEEGQVLSNRKGFSGGMWDNME